MPAFAATAPGKVILFGEHAVVYGQPAIAIPLLNVQARAAVFPDLKGQSGHVRIEAPAIQLNTTLSDLGTDHPIGLALRLCLQAAQIEIPPACTLRISSTIPLASGLGSGAAVSIAIIRSFSAFLGRPAPDEAVNKMAYEVEKLYHGNPSGIDNTVITYARSVFYQRGNPLEFLQIANPFTFVIGDTGIPYPTADAVRQVRIRREQDPEQYDSLFERVGMITRKARLLIERGTPNQVGLLMNENHQILQAIGVSSQKLDQLVLAAQEAGAYGAKLSGAGMGGNIVALVSPEQSDQIEKAILDAGGISTIRTTINP